MKFEEFQNACRFSKFFVGLFRCRNADHAWGTEPLMGCEEGMCPIWDTQQEPPTDDN